MPGGKSLTAPFFGGRLLPSEAAARDVERKDNLNSNNDTNHESFSWKKAGTYDHWSLWMMSIYTGSRY
jgi:hypothetical protein